MIKKGEKKLEFSHLERKWLELTGKENIKVKLQEIDLNTKVKEYEKELIQEALEICQQNITKTSLFLKIPRQTLQRKIKQYNL